MKQKVFFILALLLMAAMGATAQTYNVTVQEGVEEADKWSATPNPAEKRQKVKIKYDGTKKVKRLKAVKQAPAYAIGLVICADGRTYETVAKAEAAGKIPAGVIVYLGNESDCTNGLAIALNNEGGKMTKGNAINACANHTPTVTGGTWRLPSTTDWEKILTTTCTNWHADISGLKTIIENAGGSFFLNKGDDYWTSTGNLALDRWDDIVFYGFNTATPMYVRAVLAF